MMHGQKNIKINFKPSGYYLWNVLQKVLSHALSTHCLGVHVAAVLPTLADWFESTRKKTQNVYSQNNIGIPTFKYINIITSIHCTGSLYVTKKISFKL